jgi:hypothetical protein
MFNENLVESIMVCALTGTQWWYHGIKQILSVFYQTPQNPIIFII